MPLSSAEARDRVASLGGLLLAGGADVDPQLYGEDPQPATYGVNLMVDEFEIALTRAALDAEVPVLAICRGIQVLNVALGGSLDQHITGREGLVVHGIPNGGGGALHEVSVEPGSRLAKALGTDRATGMSHHHQAVDRLAVGLTVTATAPDGIVEAVEVDGPGWCVAVQWHPEDTAATDPVQQSLFDAFVQQAC
jgi:putative glutamine amidotransferase